METTETGEHSLYSGKTAVISGGSSGIGLGIAKHLAGQGARVVLIGRSPEKLEKAVAEIASQGGTAVSASVDVREADALKTIMAEQAEVGGAIDLVVAAAAGNFFVPAERLSPNGFKTVLEIDLAGTFNLFSGAFPVLRRPGASLIAISAPQSQRAMPNQAHVCAAKAGIDMLVKCLAMEWGVHGIRVNAVSPGPIAGTEGLARLSASPEIEQFVRDNTALRRFGDVGDIARAVSFLASPQAGYVTGTILDCDAGMRLANFPAL